MIKRRNLMVYILLAFLIGAGFASFATKITSSCPPLPDEPAAECVSFDKALLHPKDLLLNSQGSLVQFLINLLVVFVVVLILLISVDMIMAWTKKNRSH
jgi:hypothetical protein